jgi:hypothetical protein
MAKSSKKPSASARRRRSTTRGGAGRGTTSTGARPPSADPLLEKTLAAVADRARMAGVSPAAYIRGVMTGRYERLSPRELGE